MNRQAFFIIIAFSIFFVAACGDAPDNQPNEKKDPTEINTPVEPPIPEWEITPTGVECKNGADITEITTPGDCTTTRCAWLCANYKNQKPVHVAITFRGCGDELPEIFSEDIQSTEPVVCEAILTNQ